MQKMFYFFWQDTQTFCVALTVYLKASYSQDTNLLPGGCCGQKYCCQSWSTYVSRIAILTGSSGVKGHPLKILEKKIQCKDFVGISDVSLILTKKKIISTRQKWIYMQRGNKTIILSISCIHSDALTILDLKISSKPDKWVYWFGTLRRWTISKSVRTPGPWHSPTYIRRHLWCICTNSGTWL